MITPRIIILWNRSLSCGFLTSDGLSILNGTGLVPVEASLLNEGRRLRFVREVDVGVTRVTLGETAIVSAMGENIGAAYILLKKRHCALESYGNMLVLWPQVNDETIEALEVIA